MSKIEDWKVGDNGIIVSNEHSHSKFSVGDIVIITSIEDDFVWCKNVNNETGCADFRDIERIEKIGESKRKYRICDILGVDVGQKFCVSFELYKKYIQVNKDGEVVYTDGDLDASDVAIYAINHPESITIVKNKEDVEYAQKIYNEIPIKDIGFKKLKPGVGCVIDIF